METKDCKTIRTVTFVLMLNFKFTTPSEVTVIINRLDNMEEKMGTCHYFKCVVEVNV